MALDEELHADLLSVAGGKERLRYYLARYRPALLKDAMASDLIMEIHRAKVRHFAEIAPSIPLRPGVFWLHEAHTADLAIAVATTASKPGVEALLSQNEELPSMIELIAANKGSSARSQNPRFIFGHSRNWDLMPAIASL